MEMRARKWSDLCVNEGQKLSKYRVSLAEGRKKEKSKVFSRKMGVLYSASTCSDGIFHIENDGEA